MITLVTTLYDIGRDSLEGDFYRGFDEHYLTWFQHFLRLDHPKIVFCDESLNDVIGSQAYTINKPISFLKDTFQYPYVQELRKRWHGQPGWLQHSPQAKLEFYNTLVMNKPFFMQEAVELNPFNTEYFLWVDAGVTHTTDPSLFTPPFEENITPYLEKLLFLVFEFKDNSDIHGFPQEKMDYYAGTQSNYVVRAMLWGGPKDLIKEFVPVYDDIMRTTLKDGYMGTEENLLTLATHKIPEKCNIQYIHGGFIRNFLSEIR